MDALRARAIRTVYRMIELTQGQMDQNDILALGEFFGSLDLTDEQKQARAEDTARRRSQGAKDGWEIRRAKQNNAGL